MIQYNYILLSFLVLFCAGTLGRLILTKLNLRHLRRNGHAVPDELKGFIDEATLSRMTHYTEDSSRLTLREALTGDAVTLAVVLSGVLPWYAGILDSLHLHVIVTGLLFLAGPAAIGAVLEIPFDLFRTFVIEKRYGFSTITLKLWILDLIKGLAISVIVGTLVVGALLGLMYHAPTAWWIWGWLLFALFQLFVLWLYPVLVAPLFNTYEPLKDEELRRKILALIGKSDFRAREIVQVDAARRSTHSNAYFTGLGRTRRIVLYDTLLSSHPHDEILSILAHEIGHWKKKHLLRQLFILESISLAAFYVFSRLLNWHALYLTFGFSSPSHHAGILLVSIFAGALFLFFKPIASFIARIYEKEADRYVLTLTGTTRPLIEALKRLAKNNLTNLFPHPLYAWFFYSHPPILRRIALLREVR
ncbi:MAG: M48 family metallopeptidase [Deltaproteobacteria bacterium]|nr:M48 family metallopeptidase [Deltaproteobacteria bacterium]